jgi:carbamoyl-phosphate synthase large subunit
MLGRKLQPELLKPDSKNLVSVKEAVFSFNKFEGTTIFLGPEMKSTGEVMGIGTNFPMAFAKAQLGSSLNLPKSGKVFCSFGDQDKSLAVSICKHLEKLGYQIVATSGTASFLEQVGITIERVSKVSEGRPNIADMLKNGEIALIFNVPAGKEAYEDSTVISKIALSTNVPVITTITGAAATVQALESIRNEELTVQAIQEFHSTEPDLKLALL